MWHGRIIHISRFCSYDKLGRYLKRRSSNTFCGFCLLQLFPVLCLHRIWIHYILFICERYTFIRFTCHEITGRQIIKVYTLTRLIRLLSHIWIWKSLLRRVLTKFKRTSLFRIGYFFFVYNFFRQRSMLFI